MVKIGSFSKKDPNELGETLGRLGNPPGPPKLPHAAGPRGAAELVRKGESKKKRSKTTKNRPFCSCFGPETPLSGHFRVQTHPISCTVHHLRACGAHAKAVARLSFFTIWTLLWTYIQPTPRGTPPIPPSVHTRACNETAAIISRALRAG